MQILKVKSSILLLLLLTQTLFAQDEDESTSSLKLKAITGKYVHSWIAFPVISGKKLGKDAIVTVTPKKGVATVAIFLASWCVPCQEQINFFKRLQTTFEKRYTQFVFILAHDLEQDALNFVQHYKLEGEMILADVKLMDSFHLPNLPAVYIGDRYGWLSWRGLALNKDKHESLYEFLDLITAL